MYKLNYIIELLYRKEIVFVFGRRAHSYYTFSAISYIEFVDGYYRILSRTTGVVRNLIASISEIWRGAR